MTEDLMRGKRDELRKAIADQLLDDISFNKLEKQCRSLAEEISDGVFEQIKSELSWWITDHIRAQAQAAIEALIAGNMDVVKKCLKITDDWGSEDHGREQARRPWFNGTTRLHEFAGVELRHKIVDQYAELLKDERIKDLEIQQEALIEKYYPMEFGGALNITREALKKALKFLPKERDDPELCALLKSIERLHL